MLFKSRRQLRRKLKGFIMLEAVTASILIGLLALSLVQLLGGQFTALAASRGALQAQQYAQAEADTVRNTAYDQLSTAAHGKTAISGAGGWMSTVTLGSETTVNNIKHRVATIEVYRNSSVTKPDFSLKVPVSSKGGGDITVESNYIIFGQDMILCWGSGSVSGRGDYTISFPKPIKNIKSITFGSIGEAEVNNTFNFTLLSYSANSASVRYVTEHPSNWSDSFSWMVMGELK